MATKTTLEHRRRVRGLQTKIDNLLVTKEQAIQKLNVARAELKHLRARGTK